MTLLERFRDLDPSRKLIVTSAVGVFALLIWSSVAQIDEVTHGMGKVIPSSKAQVVQAADPAVVKTILVRGGQSVKKGQLLVRLDDAQAAKLELERLEQESTLILRKARTEAEAIVTQSRADADRLREEIRQKAKAEAEGIMRNAERQIQLETSRALQQIRSEAVDLSISIASKIIQRNISKEDNERLIADALKQVEGRAN